MTDEIAGLKIWVHGIVQGVGFRPFTYTQAQLNNLTGWVRNTSSGVEIEINGKPDALQRFLNALRESPPKLARIDQLDYQSCIPNSYRSFEIISSQLEPGEFIPISPDMSICSDCRRELFSPSDRRYRYPFINCTNCGPRFSIIQDIPYDRPRTTMSHFPMCPECQAEYENPMDRRFHAQPIACPVCGPHVWLESNGEHLAERDDAIQLARAMLQMGKILAIKGLGGFHLACDASNATAVAELRMRKKRSDKPFALMAFDIGEIEEHCSITPAEKDLLLSPQRPIVLLQRCSDEKNPITEHVAPNQPLLGVMLPYTPLHLLLLEPASGFPEMLVMTSGNLSEEPIAYQDDEARQRLIGLADAFLFHDRPIHMRVDDSVSRITSTTSAPYLIRRARGFAPDPLQLSQELPPILAVGAELKNTFCLTQRKYAFLSHYIGDLENYETLRSFEEGIAHYERLFRVQPEILACDLHPDYLATRYAQHRSREQSLPLVGVQHHHAHLAACLADNGWESEESVIGLTFDGTGLGIDHSIWGGEFLLGGYKEYQRLFHLANVSLPGGVLAIRKPSRMALAHLWQAGMEWDADLPPVMDLCQDERLALRAQLEHHLNSPLTSSMGRLFDSVSALLGICEKATYEGQAAIELEALVDWHERGFYPFEIRGDEILCGPLWQGILSDWRAGAPLSILATRFHNSLVELSLEICEEIRNRTGCNVVALSGGVWQNMYFLNNTLHCLKDAGFYVLYHQRTPPNDGSIALGQALIAAKNYQNGIVQPLPNPKG